jgi:YHS domain-containing protein
MIVLLVAVVFAAPALAQSCCGHAKATGAAAKACSARIPEQTKQQLMIMMQAQLFLDSPAAILGQAQTLELSDRQSRELLEIQKQARQKALAVLTEAQKQKLGKVSAEPSSLASLCRSACGEKMTGKAAEAGGQVMPCIMQWILRGQDKQAQAAEQTTCPISGGKINKEVFTEYKDRKVYFCCAGCIGTFTTDPGKYLDKLPQFKKPESTKKSEGISAASEQQVCPVMGGRISKNCFTEHQGKKVYFCCPGCKPKFQADPARYIAKLPQFKD